VDWVATNLFRWNDRALAGCSNLARNVAGVRAVRSHVYDLLSSVLFCVAESWQQGRKPTAASSGRSVQYSC
jgi:hypothetical protein